MVANSIKRRQFDDLITSFAGPRCDYNPRNTTVVYFPAAGSSYPSGRVGLRVANVAAQAFRALAAVMLHYGYAFEETAGGTLNCRYIGGTTVTSFHAHGIAGDWNPSRNRYRVSSGLIQWGRQTDMPKAMVEAIEAIKSVSGHRVFEWGGRWSNIKDPMHYELDIYRAHLTTGINLATLPAGAWTRYNKWLTGTPTPIGGNDPMLGLDIGKEGDAVVESVEVATLQKLLIDRGQDLGEWGPNGDGVDGRAGDDTRRGLNRWKTSAGITSATSGGEGRIGPYEYAALNLPAAAGTIDQTARNAAKAAQTAANRANTTLDKIRSE